MVDSEGNSEKKKDDAKTRGLGKMPLSTAKKMRGWSDYQKYSEALTKAREDSETSKKGIRAQILNALVKKGVKTEDGTPVDHSMDIDFVIEGETVRIVEVLIKGKGRSKSQDFSDLF